MSGVKQWTVTNSPLAGDRYDDVFFINSMRGWAVKTGRIFDTSDGGKTWRQSEQTFIGNLRCIVFANEMQGWFGSWSGALTDRLHATTDGGISWYPVNLPKAGNHVDAVCGMSIPSGEKNTVYAVGKNYPDKPPGIFKSADRGANWAFIDMAIHANCLIDVFFATPTTGWAVGGIGTGGGGDPRKPLKAVVLYTTDGGVTWQDQTAALRQTEKWPASEWCWKMYFLNDRSGYISIESPLRNAFLKTTDGGASWNRFEFPTELSDGTVVSSRQGVGFISDKLGWLGGRGDFPGTVVTVDGGATWKPHTDSQVLALVNRFRAVANDPSIMYAAGKYIYKYSDEDSAQIAQHCSKGVSSPAKCMQARIEGAVLWVTLNDDSRALLSVEATVYLSDPFGRPLASLNHKSGYDEPAEMGWKIPSDVFATRSLCIRLVCGEHVEALEIFFAS